MGLEEVKKEILNNARSQAKQLQKEGEKESQAIMASAEAKVAAIKERADKEADFEIEQYRTVSMAEAASITKKKMLSFGEVIEQTKDKLEKLSVANRQKHLNTLLKDTTGYAKVYVSKKDVSAVKKQKASEIDILGGAILENSEGNVRLDMSYETLLGQLKQEKLAEVSKMLFG
jgi:V/A-type H+/Na+-transporting ATPase subunit E